MAVEQISRSRVERQLAAIMAGQRMAAAEPTESDAQAARSVLAGEVRADDAIREGLVVLEERFGFSR